MKSFIPWIGGKSQLASTIVSMFPSGFQRYIEVFGGAASVLFSKDKHAPLEVYNDADGRLVNLFRCIKYHCSELQREIDGFPNSRELFLQFKDQLDSPALTDIQRAARFFLLIRLSFGADTRTFGCKSQNLDSTIHYLNAVQQRLNGPKSVVIEHKNFDNLIQVYDRSDALFYCDPPYFGTGDFYSAPFSLDSHRLLRDCLANLKGRFILSYNDHPFLRQLYHDFHISPVSRSNNLSNGHYKELLITNY